MSDSSPPIDQSVQNLPVLPASSARTLGELAIRPPIGLWDRVKILLGLVALWWILCWATVTNNPIEPFSAAAGHELQSLLWLEVLAGIEFIRQIHYFISERSRHWHHFWSVRIFGRLTRATGRTSDWTRYRIGRVTRVVVFLAVLAVILAGFYHVSPAVSLFQVPAAFFNALPFIFQLAFAFFFIAFQFIGLFWLLSRGGIDVYFPGDVKTRFSDVWGQDSVLDRVKENIIFLRSPEAIEARGGYVPGGILLWGPPGTGKTLMAEAVAGETHNPFVFVDPGAFTNMFMGIGILKVKSLFRKLRKLCVRYGGVVVFFDEADSLGNRGALTPGGVFGPNMRSGGLFSATSCNAHGYFDARSRDHLMRLSAGTDPDEEPPQVGTLRMMAGAMMGGGGQGTLQSLLSELSGLKKPRGFFNRNVRRVLGMQPKPPPKYRILVMMATNMPQSLDEALLRPGRIDRIYKVGYPSKAGRVRTYSGYLSKVAHNLTDEEIDRLATVTPYATGATIKDLVNEALINTIREGRTVITWKDVMKAKQLKDLGPPEDVEYIERERHAVAIHEACHAVTAARVRKNRIIDIATIEKGGSYLGMVSNVRAEDTFTEWRSDYESMIMVCLASLAGEKMFFAGDNSSGVSGDLESATHIATFMEGYWGMGQTVASHGVTKQAGITGGGENGQGRRNQKSLFDLSLGGRIESKLHELMERTEELLSENRLEIFAVSHALEAHKTITGDDVLAIIDGRQGPLIDGRRYHTPKFKELAEDYHEQVVVAHINHGHVDVSLPELPELDAQGEPPSTANVAPTGVHANGSDAHVGTSSEET
jgi:ATP-dependent Zn protease